jgi:5,10-methylene-tetrahydrofolate dehydrogenase/methenyl tetrahydrofolate cyclohydrolase
MTINDELNVIDETIAELEGRRIEIINRMEVSGRPRAAAMVSSANVVEFPTRPSVVVSSYSNARHVW